MRVLLIKAVLVAVVSPLCVLHAMADNDKSSQGIDSVTQQVITDRLQKKEGLQWFKELGFNSPDQLSKASIDFEQGFPLYFLRLDKLKSYKKGTDPWPLLIKTNAYIYPLMLDKNLVSSVTVSFKSEQEKTDAMAIPHIVELGDIQRFRLLTESSRSEFPEKGNCGQTSECIAVTIPALGLHLFGYRREGDTESKESRFVILNLVPGHVRKEDIRSAEEVFEKLSNQAEKYDLQPSHRPDAAKKWVPKEPKGGKDASTN